MVGYTGTLGDTGYIDDSGSHFLKIGAFKLTGGETAISYDWGDSGFGRYVVITDKKGESYVFDGVTMDTGGAFNGAAYQLNGTIHEGRGENAGLSMNEFIHEYGHYLQQQESQIGYIGVIAESAYKSVTKDDNYYGSGNEKNASERGNAYMDT